jgi:hypothetical protein
LKYDFPSYPNPSFHQIELDINRRTIQLDSEDVTSKFPGLIVSIRNVLMAYTKRNPVIGYT